MSKGDRRYLEGPVSRGAIQGESAQAGANAQDSTATAERRREAVWGLAGNLRQESEQGSAFTISTGGLGEWGAQ